MTTAYPLTWPVGWPRTPGLSRKSANFGTKEDVSSKYGNGSWKQHKELTIAVARERLNEEVTRLGVRNPILSTNVELRSDGQPRSDRRDPADPGVALYFTIKGKPVVLACDKWDRVADNIAAIAKHIESIRGQARWGVGSLEQAFAGYDALPGPETVTKRTWRQVLQLEPGARPSADLLRSLYRKLAMERHPDRGGNDALMAELNSAHDEAKRELGYE